jgi:hypothetical protein
VTVPEILPYLVWPSTTAGVTAQRRTATRGNRDLRMFICFLPPSLLFQEAHVWYRSQRLARVYRRSSGELSSEESQRRRLLENICLRADGEFAGSHSLVWLIFGKSGMQRELIGPPQNRERRGRRSRTLMSVFTESRANGKRNASNCRHSPGITRDTGQLAFLRDLAGCRRAGTRTSVFSVLLDLLLIAIPIFNGFLPVRPENCA